MMRLSQSCMSLQSRLTLCDPMGHSLPSSSVHGILQARILEAVAISYPKGIFPTQGPNPSLLYLLLWQVDSLLLSHNGNPLPGYVDHLWTFWMDIWPGGLCGGDSEEKLIFLRIQVLHSGTVRRLWQWGSALCCQIRASASHSTLPNVSAGGAPRLCRLPGEL